MFDKLRREFRQLKQGEPGKRFQSQYETHQQSSRPKWSRPLSIVLGIVIVAGGIVALPAPGPGILIVAFGGALLARESRVAARALDWLELRLRMAWSWSKRHWKAASFAVRAIVVLAAASLAGGAGYLAWIWFLRDRFT